MIIGNGFLAKNLQRFELDPFPLHIVAAGVGNSQCRDSTQFKREMDLLKDVIAMSINSSQPIVYISSVIADSKSPYAIHKCNCENLISKGAPSYCIVRVPQLIGMYQSDHSLVGYLSKCISEGVEFELYVDQRRNIIGVETISDYIKYWSSTSHNRVVTLCNPEYIAVRDLVVLLESVLGKRARYRARNSCQPAFRVKADPDWDELVTHGINVPDSYSSLVKKYVKQIVSNVKHV